MRLLLGNNLSPRLVEVLAGAGRDVVHVRTLGLAALLTANLSSVESDLRVGSVVVFGDDHIRIRRPPIA